MVGTLNQEIAHFIHQGRMLAVLSLEEAAAKLSVSVETLREYESGETIPASTVVKMIRLYKSSSAEFMQLLVDLGPSHRFNRFIKKSQGE